MEVNPQRISRTGEYAVLAVGLGVMEIILVWLMVLIRDVATASGDAPSGMVHLAWIALVALCVNTMLIVWIFLRSMKVIFRSGKIGKPSKSTYVDAWALAGKRLELDDDDQIDTDFDTNKFDQDPQNN